MVRRSDGNQLLLVYSMTERPPTDVPTGQHTDCFRLGAGGKYLEQPLILTVVRFRH